MNEIELTDDELDLLQWLLTWSGRLERVHQRRPERRDGAPRPALKLAELSTTSDFQSLARKVEAAIARETA